MQYAGHFKVSDRCSKLHLSICHPVQMAPLEAQKAPREVVVAQMFSFSFEIRKDSQSSNQVNNVGGRQLELIVILQSIFGSAVWVEALSWCENRPLMPVDRHLCRQATRTRGNHLKDASPL